MSGLYNQVMKLRRWPAAVPVLMAVVAFASTVLWWKRSPPNPSEIALTFNGRTKWIDPTSGMADGREGVSFTVANASGASLCVAAIAANDSMVFPLNSVGFGLRPHSDQHFEVLVPTSSIPWRVVVSCTEAVHVDPDASPWQKIYYTLDTALNGRRYYFEKRGGAQFKLVSKEFKGNDS